MMNCRGKLSGKFYLVSLILVALIFIMAGCDSGTVGDIDSDDGIVTDGDLDGAKLFAQNLSDHSINLMELGTAQAENLEEGMLEQVGPYAEATFYRMVWIGEIMDMWEDHMNGPGEYIIDFPEYMAPEENDNEISKDEKHTWTFIIKNFYDDLNSDVGAEEAVYHKVTITGYPDDHYDFIDDSSVPYKRYINLAEADFIYEHKRFIGDEGLTDGDLLTDQGEEDISFNWSFDFSLNSESTEEVFLYTEENYYLDDSGYVETEYYYILPINPDYDLAGTLEDDLLIDDNSDDAEITELNNDDGTPPYLGSITVNSNLETDSDAKIMTVTGDITATSGGRQTVEFNGEAIIDYNEFVFEDENVVIDLIDFDSSSSFTVDGYFEITGGLTIEFSELMMEPEAYFSLSVPEKIVLDGNYKDLSEADGMELSGDISVEFLNIDDYNFEAEDSEDNFARVKVSINGDLSSDYAPIALEMALERTGFEEVTIDPLNYSFADGSSMEGSGMINQEELELNAWCNSDVLIAFNLVFADMDSDDHGLGEVRNGSNNIIADITFTGGEMVFEFIDGETIAMFPKDTDQ